jgi:hypothetical protein
MQDTGLLRALLKIAKQQPIEGANGLRYAVGNCHTGSANAHLCGFTQA